MPLRRPCLSSRSLARRYPFTCCSASGAWRAPWGVNTDPDAEWALRIGKFSGVFGFCPVTPFARSCGPHLGPELFVADAAPFADLPAGLFQDGAQSRRMRHEQAFDLLLIVEANE